MLALLKSLQQSTRMLQTYCGHSKVARDTRVINNVPPLKKALEQFLFKVKVRPSVFMIISRRYIIDVCLQELVSVHCCSDAFWIGNLKNRDITVHHSHSRTKI